ncbi:MAG: hypothetical protein O2913_13210 [Chloroflexi bacterium]|nr:hypothetical protein [Chloroflexota bacterium]
MINAFDVLVEAERRGVKVQPRGERLIYRGSRSALSPEFMESLRYLKQEILSILWERQSVTEKLLAWASMVSEDEVILQDPVRFHETPLRPVAVTEISQYALRQLKLISRSRIEQDTGGMGRFGLDWWRLQEEEALSALASLKEAMEQW